MMLQEKASNVLDSGKAWEQGQSTGTIGRQEGRSNWPPWYVPWVVHGYEHSDVSLIYPPLLPYGFTLVFWMSNKEFPIHQTTIIWHTWFSGVVPGKERSSPEQVWLWHSERYLSFLQISILLFIVVMTTYTSLITNVYCNSVLTMYCEVLEVYTVFNLSGQWYKRNTLACTVSETTISLQQFLISNTFLHSIHLSVLPSLIAAMNTKQLLLILRTRSRSRFIRLALWGTRVH